MEHIGVVTGLSDLLNFLAALRRRTSNGLSATPDATAVLFGAETSLPRALVSEFDAAVRQAFPTLKAKRVSSACVQGNSFKPDTSVSAELRRKGDKQRVVYGNAIHKRFHQEFYAYLQPDEFVFFDNGLSSYAEHAADIEREFRMLNIPYPSLACYSLNPPLKVPSYLAQIPGFSLGMEDYQEAFAALRRSSLGLEDHWRARHVIIGTSLFRGSKITWSEERAIYVRLIERLKSARHSDHILYKAHPRASDRPLITKDDGVEVVDSSLPAEPFVDPESRGTVYSITSTALFTFTRLFSWQARRIETPASRRLLDASPHLSLIDLIPATPIEEL